jgi:ribosomal protein S4E
MPNHHQFPPKGTWVKVVNAGQHTGKTGRIEQLDDSGAVSAATVKLDDGKRILITGQSDIEPE